MSKVVGNVFPKVEEPKKASSKKTDNGKKGK